MEPKEEKKKESALNINEEFDFNFAKKIPKALRWILVIPVGLLSLFVVQFAYGFIVNMILKNVSETSIIALIINGIFGFIKYYIFTIAMVAMAPVNVANKFKAGIGLSVVPLAIVTGVTFLLIKGTAEASTGYAFPTTQVAVQAIVVVLATIAALIYIKMEINKGNTTPNTGTELNQ